MTRTARRVRLGALVALAVLAPFVLASCSGLTGSLAHRVSQWAAGSGVVAADQLVAADAAGVDAGIARHLLAQTHTACDGLASDAATAYGQLPTPDAELTNLLSESYLAYSRAAQDCTDASHATDAAFASYRSEAARAARLLARATSRLAQLGVR
ncbi:MAG: hypothetical protein M0Z33_05465 [Actinomycetota bacterium]|nr:hypothetical protein [Actinomycetota bacterium]